MRKIIVYTVGDIIRMIQDKDDVVKSQIKYCPNTNEYLVDTFRFFDFGEIIDPKKDLNKQKEVSKKTIRKLRPYETTKSGDIVLYSDNTIVLLKQSVGCTGILNSFKIFRIEGGNENYENKKIRRLFLFEQIKSDDIIVFSKTRELGFAENRGSKCLHNVKYYRIEDV